jgi:hypothetical protein
MMNKHLSTTTDEVVARLTKNWDADVRAYDAVYDHILVMADALSDGIIKQFPQKFAATNPVTTPMGRAQEAAPATLRRGSPRRVSPAAAPAAGQCAPHGAPASMSRHR